MRTTPGTRLLTMLLAATLCAVAAAQEPPLPEGMKPRSDEPALPQGMGSPLPSTGGEPPLPSTSDEPPLPQTTDAPPRETGPGLVLPFDLAGFWEARLGLRTQHDKHEKAFSIAETRLQLEVRKTLDWAQFNLRSDFLYDPVLNRNGIDLEKGAGNIDLREANVSFRPLGFLDVKAGRQILTWGTGDMLFINDLFPKDWNSFFIGRDQEYLKAPSDALKVSIFTAAANLDVVYTPKFDADRFIDGRRLSYYNHTLMRRAGRNAVVHADRPEDCFEDDELALRLSHYFGGIEAAAYAYHGFWKSPGGMDPVTGKATFPELSVYGASVRGPVGKGIGNIEVGYYDSREDRNGDDPFVRNSEFRALVGYEQEIAQNFTGGVQYYLEHIMDYRALRRASPPGAKDPDEDRHVFTLRLTRLLMAQNLRLSFFAYYSPSDQDAYLRPNAHYKVNDHWSVETGANLFFGKRDHTFFGQFEKNNNVYAGARYSF